MAHQMGRWYQRSRSTISSFLISGFWRFLLSLASTKVEDTIGNEKEDEAERENSWRAGLQSHFWMFKGKKLSGIPTSYLQLLGHGVAYKSAPL
jgi:hypothetical protein